MEKNVAWKLLGIPEITIYACLGQRWSVQPRRPDQLGNRLWEKVFGSNNFNETAAVNQFDLIFAETALECTQGYQNIEHGSITS